MTIEHHPPQALETFAAALFCKVGMEADKAASVARLLVHTDTMGCRTHGLAQAPAYLAEIQKGNMATTGSYVVVKDNGATSALWDGNYLPGLWLVEQAIQTCIPRAEKYGLAAIAIKRNHHIGCLAALFEHAWLQDAQGVPTRDPAVLEHTAPRGSLQLMGGAEYGRKDAPKRCGGSTFVQVISPESFSGADVFAEQMDYLSDRCRSNKPINPAQPVRMPGDQAARGIAAAQQDGIAFDADTWAALSQWAGKLGVALP